MIGLLRARAPGVIVLTVVWVLLWGSFSTLSVVGGVAVAVALQAVIRMPVIPERLPLRPLRVAALVGFLARDVVVSSVGVAWQTLRYGPRACGTVVGVPLLTPSARVVTVLADAISLTPGSMVLQIDQGSGVMYVYALGPRDRAAAERIRRQAMDVQCRVLAALGTAEQVALARRWLAAYAEGVPG